jgi:hypothetical protein
MGSWLMENHLLLILIIDTRACAFKAWCLFKHKYSFITLTTEMERLDK